MHVICVIYVILQKLSFLIKGTHGNACKNQKSKMAAGSPKMADDLWKGVKSLVILRSEL